MSARTGRIPAPFNYAHENVLFDGRLRRALHRLDQVSYPFLPVPEQVRVRDRFQQLLTEMRGDFSLYVANRAYPHHEYVEQGMGLLDGRYAHPGPWRQHLEAQQVALGEMRSFSPEVYLASSLSPRTFEIFKDALRSARRPREASLLHGVRDVVKDEESLLRHVLAGGGGRRARTHEIQWLLRRAATRALGEPDEDPNWKPSALTVETSDGREAFEPLRSSITRFTDVPVDEHPKYVVVGDVEDSPSFQCFLMLGQLPDDVWFPGGAEFLHEPLDRVDFPVDVVVHARHIDNPKAVDWARKRVIDADNAYEEEQRGDGSALTRETEENRDLARDLLDEAKSPSRPPLYFASIGFCIAAPSLEELKARREAFERQFTDVRLELPVGKQRALFSDHHLRCDGGSVRDYEDVFTPKQLASMMPIATHDVGHGRGHYFAHVAWGAKRPVHHEVRRPNRTNKPPSIMLVGSQGSGKTVAALGAFARPAILTGSICVDFDPKGDHHLGDLPEMQALGVDVIRVLDGEAGMLDPLVISPPEMKRTRGASFLWDLLPAPEPKWQTAIMRMVTHVVNLERDPTCMKVIRALRESSDEHDRAAGESLETWADFPLAKLGLAERGRDVSAKAPLTVIKARGLMLPRPGSDYRTDPERRTSVAALKLISTFQTALIYNHPGHKMLIFDEAWSLLQTDDGRQLIDEQNHMLRALNGVLLLLSQGAVDAGATENLVGERFCGRAQTKSEAGRMLGLLGLDPADDELIDFLRNCENGRFLYGDLEHRVGAVQVDITEPDVLEILDTTPDRPVVEGRAQVAA